MRVHSNAGPSCVLRLSVPVVEVVAQLDGAVHVQQRGVRRVTTDTRGQQAVDYHVGVTGEVIQNRY